MAKNIGESVNARLRALARETGQDMMSLQTRYVLERLLHRLTLTRWGNSIALKGAMIFVVEYGDSHRPTSDMDINGYDLDGGVTTLGEMIRAAAAIEADDGVVFDVGSMKIRKELAGQAVPGGKVEMRARIHTSQIQVRVDAGFGNSVIPDARLAEYPSILADMPKPMVRIYPFETTVAEKLHAMSRHGAETSRIRDYYDLWLLAARRDFDGDVLSDAIAQTFARHGAAVPAPALDGLSQDFVSRASREWDNYRGDGRLRFAAPDLQEVVAVISGFVGPALEAAAGGPAAGSWQPGSGWSSAPSPAQALTPA